MISKDKIQLIQALYTNGETKTNIAKTVGVSIPTVSRHVCGIEKADEMIGKRFGSLLVLERAKKDPTLASRCLRYKCQCDCGNKIEVNGNSLRSGHTTSCGCSRKQSNIVDITGKSIDLVKVLRLHGTDNIQHRAVWECQCECGREFLASSHSLLSGKQKSCGCLKESAGEKKIQRILEENNICFMQQYKVAECKSIQPLPFDFAIFSNNELVGFIEYQGDIHYITTGGWNTKEELLKRQERDTIKREFCRTNKIPLLEIPYWDYEKIDIEYIKKGLSCGL